MMSAQRQLLGPCVAALLLATPLSASPTGTVRCQLHDVVLQDNTVNYDGVATCDSGSARIQATYSSTWRRLTSGDSTEIEVHFEPGHTYEIDADQINGSFPSKAERRAATREFPWGLAVVEDSERLIGFVSNCPDVTAFVDHPRPRVFMNELTREGSIVTGRLIKKGSVPYAGLTLSVRFWSSDGKPRGEARTVRIARLISPQPMRLDIEFEIPGAIPDDVAATTVQVIDREVLLRKEYKRRLSESRRSRP